MNTKLLLAAVLATGMMTSGAALADMTKTTTTETTVKTDAVVGVKTPVADADVGTTTTTKTTGYVAYDTNGNNRLDPEEYMTYSYNVIDIDGDKYITDEEYTTYKNVWYKPVTAKDVKVEEFVKLDANADGRIDFDEYNNGTTTTTTVFTSWDADGNGYVDDTEYKTVVTEYQTIDTDGIYTW